MARRKPPLIPDALLDQLLAGADAKATFEKDGLRDGLKKAPAERVLNAEMDHHLGAGDGRANSRNGCGQKTVRTDTGKIPLDVPRDRRSLDSRFKCATKVCGERLDRGSLTEALPRR